ncbi:hypothetical protein [Tropicimonas sp. S265A]|uniref:hypothetical protein n=1 Tax=Tropicimonas sp. S265A TaxID=3415134 RepID=UPI003C7A35EA
MTLMKTILFSLQNMSRYSLNYAGAELCGGDTRRARSDAYRHLKNMSAVAVQAQVFQMSARMRDGITEQVQDRP